MDISEEQWQLVRRYIPDPERMVTSPKGGRPWRDPRDVLNGVLWVLRTGAPLGRHAEEISALFDLLPTVPALGERGRPREAAARPGRGLEKQRSSRPDGGLHRRLPRGGKKGGPLVGITRRGKATKIMAVADRAGLPVAVWIASGPRNETKLVAETLDARFTRALPRKLIGDRGYDSDPLDRELKKRGIEMIAPNQCTRAIQSQDRRKLRYVYKRRWLIERLFAWLMRCRRLVTRYETKAEMFLGLLRLACARLLWKRL